MSKLSNHKHDPNLLTVNGVQFTNNSNIPTELALMFAYHSTLYDGKPSTPTNISVSDIIGPMRKLLYKVTTDSSQLAITDVSSIAKSSIGTILHTGMEQALESYGGYTQEKRSEVVIEGVTISGKFDIVAPNGELKDLKNESSFSYKLLMEDKKAIQPGLSMEEIYEQFPSYAKFAFQLSLYAYLNPDIVTQPYGSILFNLTSSSMEKFPLYNQVRFPLFPADEVHEFLTNRIRIMQSHLAADTKPWCSPNERGSKPAQYKLTRLSPKTGKFFTVKGSKFADASLFRDFVATKGQAGDVEDIQEAKHVLCEYCNYSHLCSQI